MRYIIILILIVFISGCACVGNGGRSSGGTLISYIQR